MPTATYDLIASTTLAASSSTVTFGSLPQTYRDLVVVIAGTTSAGDGIYIRLNGDTGANYSFVRMFGTGTTTGSSSATGQTSGEFGEIWPNPNNNLLQLMDYSATDKHKTWLSRTNPSTANAVMAHAGRWANTAAVTSLQVLLSSTTFSTGTTFALYGIAS